MSAALILFECSKNSEENLQSSFDNNTCGHRQTERQTDTLDVSLDLPNHCCFQNSSCQNPHLMNTNETPSLHRNIIWLQSKHDMQSIKCKQWSSSFKFSSSDSLTNLTYFLYHSGRADKHSLKWSCSLYPHLFDNINILLMY